MPFVLHDALWTHGNTRPAAKGVKLVARRRTVTDNRATGQQQASVDGKLWCGHMRYTLFGFISCCILYNGSTTKVTMRHGLMQETLGLRDRSHTCGKAPVPPAASVDQSGELQAAPHSMTQHVIVWHSMQWRAVRPYMFQGTSN
jgi:hypothetical protein